MTDSRSYNVKKVLSSLPKKILHNKNHSTLIHAVLYEIAHEFCFHFDIVSYFVYNPDFFICKGFGGISRKEVSGMCDDPWCDLNNFEATIANTPYNQKIVSIDIIFKEKKNVNEVVSILKEKIEDPEIHFFQWAMPNGNIGIILYHPLGEKEHHEDHIDDFVGILSHCPLS